MSATWKSLGRIWNSDKFATTTVARTACKIPSMCRNSSVCRRRLRRQWSRSAPAPSATEPLPAARFLWFMNPVARSPRDTRRAVANMRHCEPHRQFDARRNSFNAMQLRQNTGPIARSALALRFPPATQVPASFLLVAGSDVRFVAILLVFLGMCGWTLAHWPQAAATLGQPEYSWRRTAAGWEREDRWPNHLAESNRLNPLLVGSLQLGVSLVALMAGADADRLRQQRGSQPAIAPTSRGLTQEHVQIRAT